MRRHAVAAATIVLAALTIFGPPLRYGEVFTFRDHTDYFQPLRFFTMQHLRAAHLPLWNPYNGSGEAWLANPQTGVFYPPTWLFVAMPFAYAYTIYLLLHSLILGSGAYALFRRASTSQAAALVGAVALMLCGPVLSLLDVQNNFATFAWVPWILWRAFADRASRGVPRAPEPELRSPKHEARSTKHGPVISGALLALAFLAGEPFYAAVAAVLYALIVRRSRTIATAAAFACALSAVQLFPFLEMLAGSDRAGGFDARDILKASMPLRDWLLLFIHPRFHIVPGQRFIVVTYASAFVIALAVAGAIVLALRRELRRLAMLLMSIAIVMFVASGPAFLAHLPLTIFRYPARVVPFAMLAIVSLAVTGWDALRRKSVIVDAVLIIAIFLDLLGPTRVIRTFGPFSRARIPYDASIGRDRKLIQLYHDNTLGTSNRAAWISGYQNLFDLRFAAGTPAPVTSKRSLDLYYDALAHLHTLRDIGAGWVLTDTNPGPPFVRVAGVEHVSAYRVEGALPMAYVLTREHEIVPVRTLALDASRARMHVVTEHPGTLVLTQNDASGWSVRIDGRDAKKARIFGTFRAVAISAGTHDVEWCYRPPSVAVGAVVTFLALLYCGLLSSTSRMKNFFAAH